MKITFTANSFEDYENRLALHRLAFERAMERFDIDAANIAAARIEYLETKLNSLKP